MDRDGQKTDGLPKKDGADPGADRNIPGRLGARGGAYAGRETAESGPAETNAANPTHHIHWRTGRAIRIPTWERRADPPGAEDAAAAKERDMPPERRSADDGMHDASSHTDKRPGERIPAQDKPDGYPAAQRRYNAHTPAKVQRDTHPLNPTGRGTAAEGGYAGRSRAGERPKAPPEDDPGEEPAIDRTLTGASFGGRHTERYGGASGKEAYPGRFQANERPGRGGREAGGRRYDEARGRADSRYQTENRRGGRYDDVYGDRYGEDYPPDDIYDDFPRGGRPPRKRRRGRGLAAFYLVLLFCGVSVTIVLFAMILNTMRDKGPQKAVTATAAPSPTPSASLVLEVSQVTGVVKDIKPDVSSITVLDPASGRTYFLKTDGKTEMMDKYHNALTLKEFALGDIVNASFYVSDFVLTELSESSQSWQMAMKKDVTVDAEAKTITIANDSYTYNDRLLVLYKDNPFDIADVGPSDTVTVTGVLDQAWVVFVEKSHGYLQVSNIDKIKGGTVEVDTDVFTQLTQDSAIDLPDGFHKVVIRGANIEPYAKDVTILPGETLYIDAGEVELKSGLLNLAVNEADYGLWVDGAEIADRVPIPLEYGVHKVRVKKDGYVTVEKDVDINQPIVDVSVALEKAMITAEVTISTTPGGASVYIDNVLAGAAPVTVTLEAGEYTLIVSLDGYKTLTAPITVTSGQMLFPVELEPDLPPVTISTPEPEQPSAQEPEQLPVYPPPNPVTPSPGDGTDNSDGNYDWIFGG
ncbi:MAG: PEGA domain-containing protein [Firmicutes bacterium]|nr:PEGA domain-containing protein [Bacillota bacterium]